MLNIADMTFAWWGGYGVLVQSFSIAKGEKVLVTGPSGSGKTTLLSLVAGLLRPNTGAITIGGVDIATLSGRARDRLRADCIGLIFQQLNLVPYLTPLQNVLLPLRFSPRRRQALAGEPEAEARRLLSALAIEATLNNGSSTALSVGQQQRVAAARALIGAPSLILADEPTSALDRAARDRFMGLLIGEASRSSAALLMVSHDPDLAKHFDRVLPLAEFASVGPRK